MDAVSENTTDDKKKELSNQLEEDGFLLHKDKGCEHGCNFCREFRRVTSWPDGIPLLKNPAAYQKPVLYQLCHHYNLKLEDLPEAGQLQQICTLLIMLFVAVLAILRQFLPSSLDINP